MASRLHRIFVNNLPWSVGVRELREHFSQFGSIATANVLFDKETGMSKGFGFVEFGHKDGQIAALRNDTHIIDDTVVNVQMSGMGSGSVDHELQ
uniref:RRM domain-containing protein n=1 Tax=Strigamia maritima TaxID=126957 RepID=T1IYE5_STRMM